MGRGWVQFVGLIGAGKPKPERICLSISPLLPLRKNKINSIKYYTGSDLMGILI